MKQKSFAVKATLLAVLGTLAQVGFAADEAQVLDEVVVSGSRTATKLSETPMSIGAVGNAAIQRTKPKTIGEVINRIAGVSWNDLGNEQHSMGIRQPNSTNAVYQYLEDGIPIRPLGVFNHNSLNELNLSDTDHVEVVRGAASSLYGSNAIGGAVNFITGRPSLTPTASIGLRDENKAGFRRLDASASNTWGDFGVSASGYSSRRSSNNWQQYSRGSKDSMTLRADEVLNASSMIHATFSYNNLDSATPGSLDPKDYQNNSGKSYQTFSWRKDKSLRLNVGWEGEVIANGLTTATLFTRKNDHGQLPSYTITQAACGGAGQAACLPGQVSGKYYGTLNNNGITSLGFDVKHQQDFGISRLIAGLYYDASPNTYVSRNLDVTRDAVSNVYTSYKDNSLYVRGNRDYKTDIKNTALYAQFEASPLDAVRLVAGLRSDNINYNFTNHLTPGVDFGAPNESRSFSHISPKLGATYALSQQASVFANLSQGFRPPEVSELYGKTAIPNLKPSTYDNFELGARAAFLDGALKLDGALYQLNGRDTIVSYTPAVGASENRNAGKTRSRGIELNATFKQGAFDVRAAGSIVSHRYVNYLVSSKAPIEDYSGKEMPSSPNTASLEVGYQPVENARIALEVVRQGSYWMNNANTVRYPGHTLFNLRGNYSLAGGWELWLQGRNLANRLYSDSASSSYKGTAFGAYTPNTVGAKAGMDSYTVGAPRSLMMGVTYNFGGKR
jgi:iron complex outermembrane recepter protein